MIPLKHDLPPPIPNPTDRLGPGNCISFQYHVDLQRPGAQLSVA